MRPATGGRAYAARGVEPPASDDLAAPPRRRSISRSAQARAGSSTTRARRSSRASSSRRCQRRAVGGVPQQRLSNALAEDPALAARGAEHLPARSVPSIGALAARADRRRARSSETAIGCSPSHAIDDAPGQARRSCSIGAMRISTSPAIRCARRSEPALALATAARPPAEPRRQPAGQQRARSRVDVAWWRTVTARIAHSAGAARRVEGRRQALAPRRRPQPCQVDDVGGISSSAARASASAGVGLAVGVEQHHVDMIASSEAMASSWPCGDHSSVGNSPRSTGSITVSRLRQMVRSRGRSRPARGSPRAASSEGSS